MQAALPTVLVVEDDMFIQAMLATVCRRSGFTAELAGDGEEALARLSLREPEVMLLDLLLPKTDGFDVLQRTAATMPSLAGRTIIITAAAEELFDGREELRGVSCILRKPLDIDRLEREMLICFGRATDRKPPQPVLRRPNDAGTREAG